MRIGTISTIPEAADRLAHIRDSLAIGYVIIAREVGKMFKSIEGCREG